MWEEILKAIPLVFVPSMLKIILGPIGGYLAGLHMVTTYIATVAGMMTVILLITYGGNWFRKRVIDRLFRNRQSSNPTGKMAMLLKKYGLPGIAFFTPLFLTPIGGALLAVGVGYPRNKIILYMLISAAAWSFIFTAAIYFFGHKVIPNFLT